MIGGIYTAIPTVHVVVPCYNEEPALGATDAKLREILGRMVASGEVSRESRVVYVDDGSTDGTWGLIERLARAEGVEGVKLSRNSGKENALWAGMMRSRGSCDALITIDADLQDDPEAIPEFVRAYAGGAEIVYGVRSSREKDKLFKRVTARGFYGFMRRMGAGIVNDHADYRLLGKRALEALSEFTEVNLFVRGLVPLLGFQTVEVPHARGERIAGETKYPFSKMAALALQGITSLSVKPIHWITFIGAAFALLGVGIALYALISLIVGKAVAGWTSLMISIWIIGGAQLIAIGLIGEYVGKAYMEAKRRPRYIVERIATGGGGE